jgi:hypothetical protein
MRRLARRRSVLLRRRCVFHTVRPELVEGATPHQPHTVRPEPVEGPAPHQPLPSRWAVPGGGDLWRSAQRRGRAGARSALQRLTRCSLSERNERSESSEFCSAARTRAAQRSRRFSADRDSVSPRRGPPGAMRLRFAGPGLRQAQPERWGGVRGGLRQAQSEPDGDTRGIRQAQPERDRQAQRAGLRQAQPERWGGVRGGLRQAQPERRGSAHPKRKGGAQPDRRGDAHPERRGGAQPERRGDTWPERGGDAQPERQGGELQTGTRNKVDNGGKVSTSERSKPCEDTGSGARAACMLPMSLPP